MPSVREAKRCLNCRRSYYKKNKGEKKKKLFRLSKCCRCFMVYKKKKKMVAFVRRSATQLGHATRERNRTDQEEGQVAAAHC